MEEKRALGRGLSSLIPLVSRSDSASKVYLEIPLEDVVPGPNQPRKLFDSNAIDELAASIQEKGILQPVIVRRLGGGKYELIAGERRFRAAQRLKLEKIPAVVKDVEPEETLELALIENLQRRDLNPIEEALAYQDLLEKYQYTQDELAKRLGRDRSSIANTLRLLRLPEAVRAYVISGRISMGHARAILAIEDRELQLKVATEIAQGELSVREIEKLVRKLKEEGEETLKLGVARGLGKTPLPQSDDRRFRMIEDDLRKRFKTKVDIRSGRGKGKIVIHFHSADDLNRILGAFGPS